MDHTYWHQQSSNNPLYPDLEWSKPERRDQAGRLGIIGGNKLGFSGVASAYEIAMTAGAGQARILLPDVLKKTIPPSITEVVFAPTTPSGSLSKDGLNEMRALGEWSTGILLVGDAGRNSETAIAYEQFIDAYAGPLTITRDAIDLVKMGANTLVDRPETLLVMSFAQTQKLFQSVYYPKILTFSMQLTQFVEALHKFTVTYPITIVSLHQEHIVIAHGGEVVTQPWDSPMRIWRGETATRIATYWLWNRDTPLAAAAASIAE